MSAKFAKGDRVDFVADRQGKVSQGKVSQGKAMRGEVFWIGESRYGKGARYGIRSEDGETHWIDEPQVTAASEAPREEGPEPPRAASGESLAKGTRVTIARGEHAGRTGEVFWVGESRYGKGSRYGVRDEAGETYWVDAPFVEPLEGPPSAAAADAKAPLDEEPRRARDEAFDDAPLPGDDDLAYADDEGAAFADDEDLPF